MRFGLVVTMLAATHFMTAQNAAYRGGCPVAVPPATNNSSAAATDSIELKRTGCTADCPAYTVRIGGDGRVAWVGASNVEVKGPAAGTIDSDAARALMQRVADRGFWALCSTYGGEASSSFVSKRRANSAAISPTAAGPAQPIRYATFTTTLSLGGQVKTVLDYNGAAPSWLREMALDIDRVSDTHRWRHGGPLAETFGGDRLVVDEVSPKAGVTQLMRAASAQGSAQLPDVLRLLTDVNARDSSGWTALMYAAQAGTAQSMNLLLEAGADVFARSNAGETALSAAVSSQSAPDAKVRLLAGRGVDVNARDNRGVSPLMLACRYGGVRRSSVIAALLALGADPSKRDEDGKAAADYLPVPQVGSAEVAAYETAKTLLIKR